MVDFVRETVIDVAGAAEFLDVAPDTIYRWMKSGRLEHAKVVGKVFTSKEAIQRAAGQSQPAANHTSSNAASTAKGLKEYGITIGR